MNSTTKHHCSILINIHTMINNGLLPYYYRHISSKLKLINAKVFMPILDATLSTPFSKVIMVTNVLCLFT